MTFLPILAIALALAVDAFSVAVACGVVLKSIGPRQAFRLSWHFGLFQTGMTLAGFGAGVTMRSLIESLDHWVAFALLLLVGGKMVLDGVSGHTEHVARGHDPTRGRSLVMLSVATSIDAMSVGLGFSLLSGKSSIWGPSFVIGVVASALTLAGLHIGARLGSARVVGRWATVVGGLVLIAIGIHILHEHGALAISDFGFAISD